MSSQKESIPQIKFLAAKPEKERAHIFKLAGELGRPLGEWVARYPQLMRPFRIPQASLTLAATAPFLSADQLLPPAHLMFWIFVVDDLFDEAPERASELLPRLERCLALLDNPQEGVTGGDPLLEIMRDARDSLASFPLFPTLRPRLVQSLRDMVKCMHRECEWSVGFRTSSQQSVPSFLEYLENGLPTTGALPLYLGVFMAIDDSSVEGCLPQLYDMALQAAISIRCANELRGYEREVKEGKLNGLVILQRELMAQQPGLEGTAALEQARKVLEARIPEGLRLCRQRLTGQMTQESIGGAANPLRTWAMGENFVGSMRSPEPRKNERTGSENPERFIMNIASFICDFYVHHDFHLNP
jgi:hypothetical protein